MFLVDNQSGSVQTRNHVQCVITWPPGVQSRMEIDPDEQKKYTNKQTNKQTVAYVTWWYLGFGHNMENNS